MGGFHCSMMKNISKHANRAWALCACIAAAGVIGCTEDKPASKTAAKAPATTPEPAPAVEQRFKAPHGGVLIPLTKDSGQLELVADPTSGTLSAYVLDKRAANPVRIGQPDIGVTIDSPNGQTSVTLHARSSFLTGEEPGDTSLFDAEVPQLVGVETFRGRVAEVEVNGETTKDIEFTYKPADETGK